MRISTQLVIVLVLLNASAGAYVASGAAAAHGVQPSVGAEDRVQSTNSTAQSFEAGGGFASTLFDLFGAIGGLFGTIYELVFFGPIMLENLGIPSFIVNMFNVALSVIVVADIAGIFGGRDI